MSTLYHRREECVKDLIKIVSVVKLELLKFGLSCEGAGQCQLEVGGDRSKAVSMIGEVGKRARGEALQAAWAKVIIVVVSGSKVTAEINTTKSDSFFYDPLWENPAVTVNEIDYFVNDSDEDFLEIDDTKLT